MYVLTQTHTHTHTHIYITCSIKDRYHQDSEYSHYPKYFLLPLCNPSFSLILYQPSRQRSIFCHYRLAGIFLEV